MTQEEKWEVERLYFREGLSTKEIASEIGLYETDVIYYINKMIKDNPRKVETNDFIANYLEQYNGDNYEACAEKEDIVQACQNAIEWADSHPNLTWEDIRKICLIAENVHKYYGFWTQSVYEEILNKFIKNERS